MKFMTKFECFKSQIYSKYIRFYTKAENGSENGSDKDRLWNKQTILTTLGNPKRRLTFYTNCIQIIKYLKYTYKNINRSDTYKKKHNAKDFKFVIKKNNFY